MIKKEKDYDELSSKAEFVLRIENLLKKQTWNKTLSPMVKIKDKTIRVETWRTASGRKILGQVFYETEKENPTEADLIAVKWTVSKK